MPNSGYLPVATSLLMALAASYLLFLGFKKLNVSATARQAGKGLLFCGIGFAFLAVMGFISSWPYFSTNLFGLSKAVLEMIILLSSIGSSWTFLLSLIYFPEGRQMIRKLGLSPKFWGERIGAAGVLLAAFILSGNKISGLGECFFLLFTLGFMSVFLVKKFSDSRRLLLAVFFLLMMGLEVLAQCVININDWWTDFHALCAAHQLPINNVFSVIHAGLYFPMFMGILMPPSTSGARKKTGNVKSGRFQIKTRFPDSLPMYRRYLQSQLQKGEIERVLTELIMIYEKKADQKKANELILQQARLSRAKSALERGIISTSKYHKIENLLTGYLLSVIQEITE